jgi:hypothetical protein
MTSQVLKLTACVKRQLISCSLLLHLSKSDALLLSNWDIAAMDTQMRANLLEIIDDIDAN